MSEELTEDQKTIQELRERILQLEQQIEWFNRQLFGSKSEKLKLAAHPDLFDPTGLGKLATEGGPTSSEEAPEEVNNDTHEAPAKTKPRTRQTRSENLPDGLPIRTTYIDPAEYLKNPTAWRFFKEEPRRHLGKDPGTFYIEEKIYRTWVALDANQNGAKPIVAKAPPTIIPGGFWLSDLLSEVICNRFLYHLPYDRQSKLYQSRHGVHLPKQTMSDGARHLADQCGVLIDLMKRDMLKCGYLRADETEAKYRDPDKPGTTGRGRFWLYKGLNGNVLFDWTLGRDHHHFLDWIGNDFEGILGSDAYEVYPKYCRLQKARGKKARRAACLAHVRRKFEEALKTKPHLAKWFLKIFGKLYQIEATLREQKADGKRKVRYRKKHSLPLIKLLQKASLHLRDQKAGRPAGRLGQAVRYLLNQGDDLETYLHHGQVEIDNNGIERDVRPLAVGRKNWLFIGSPEAGDRTAVIYSLLISARHHGVDPESYLRDLIERLPGCGSDETSLRQLLPENWAAAHKSTLDPSATPEQAVA
ncbi:IS66 family transposase [Verrucomicrobiaceae bacterium 227]